MEIRKASVQGFCFGVAITVKKAEEAIASRGDVTTLGHVVHNPQMVESLAARGLEERARPSTRSMRARSSFARTASRSTSSKRPRRRTSRSSTRPVRWSRRFTCRPRSSKPTAIRSSSSAIRTIPEVKGTLSHVPGAWCIQSPEDVERLPRSSRVGVVVQSTWSGEGFTEIVRALSAKYYEVRAVNTICTDTHNRQNEALRLAKDVEVMVVVGGKTSANTKHLADLSESHGARAYHIEGPDELQPQWFEGVEVAGLMSGASTPGWLVDEVEARMEELAASA